MFACVLRSSYYFLLFADFVTMSCIYLLLQDSSPFSALCALTELIWLKDTSMLSLEITVIDALYYFTVIVVIWYKFL